MDYGGLVGGFTVVDRSYIVSAGCFLTSSDATAGSSFINALKIAKSSDGNWLYCFITRVMSRWVFAPSVLPDCKWICCGFPS